MHTDNFYKCKLTSLAFWSTSYILNSLFPSNLKMFYAVFKCWSVSFSTRRNFNYFSYVSTCLFPWIVFTLLHWLICTNHIYFSVIIAYCSILLLYMSTCIICNYGTFATLVSVYLSDLIFITSALFHVFKRIKLF